MSIRIVTDSASDLPGSLAQEHDISVVPLYVTIGSETYKDGVDIDADHFYAQLVRLTTLPTTSQPSIGDFRQVYGRLLDQGHQIVSIHISSKLSGTFNAAAQAKALLSEGADIELVDSRLAGGALALLALRAARWASETPDHRQVARLARQATASTHGFVVVDTLKFLQMGGRIGKAQALVGGMLQFKPVVCIRDGEVHPVARPRTRRRALAQLIETVRALAPIQQLHVSYTTGPEDAETVRDALADLVDPYEVVESRFGPVLGTHLGPGTIGVGVIQAGAAGE